MSCHLITAPSVDAFHDAWVDACIEARFAYRAWCRADPEDRDEAFAVFVAAEEREQAAARGFAEALEAA